jgi:L-alanine-DL-glutamate epimerase-like enolase superfamily enzyme
MKITDVVINQPIGLLRIQTDGDVEGHCLGVDAQSAHHILSACKPLLVGQEAMDRERMWQELVRADRFSYLPHNVRGFVDVALWDLVGKITDMAVFRLLGGYRDRIPCYKSGGNLEAVDEYVTDAVQAKEEGFYGYKDHCWRGVETMSAVARAVREAVGPDFHLMHDAVQAYDYVDAIRIGRVLQDEDYYWFEEPLRDYDTMGLKQLSDALDMPIAATEYLPGSIYSTSQLIAQQAVDIVRASVPWRGGITDMIKIARLAEAFGVNCEITSVGAMHGFVHAHVIGAIRNCTFFEGWKLGSLGGEPLITNPIHIEDGHISVPEGPGLGVQLDWAEVEKATAEVAS